MHDTVKEFSLLEASGGLDKYVLEVGGRLLSRAAAEQGVRVGEDPVGYVAAVARQADSGHGWHSFRQDEGSTEVRDAPNDPCQPSRAPPGLMVGAEGAACVGCQGVVWWALQ